MTADQVATLFHKRFKHRNNLSTWITKQRRNGLRSKLSGTRHLYLLSDVLEYLENME